MEALVSDHRTRRATQAHYIIYDKPPDERRIIAIHRMYEPAAVCFNRLMKSGDFTRVLQIWQIQTNEFGYAVAEVPLYTYSKQINLFIDHSKERGWDASGNGRPPPIRAPN